MNYFYLLGIIFSTIFIKGQTYKGAFDKIEAINGIEGASYLINAGNPQKLQIIEPNYLDSYLNMFLATHDKRYLAKFIIHAKRVQNRRDDDAEYYRVNVRNTR